MVNGSLFYRNSCTLLHLWEKRWIQVSEAALDREQLASSETRTDLQKRAQGAERRCESLQNLTQELTQKHGDTEQRFQKVPIALLAHGHFSGVGHLAQLPERRVKTSAQVKLELASGYIFRRK